jgi:hypothetical protein
MSTPLKTEFKQCAKRLAQVLNEEFKTEVSHSRALQIMAKVYGYKNWNTVSAALSDDDVTPGSVGEVAAYLFRFDRNEPVIFAEYYQDIGSGFHLWADLECGTIPYHEDRPILALAEEGELIDDVMLSGNAFCEQNPAPSTPKEKYHATRSLERFAASQDQFAKEMDELELELDEANRMSSPK